MTMKYVSSHTLVDLSGPSENLCGTTVRLKSNLWALKWSVCDKFKDYLLGSKFTVFTDNNPLCYIKPSKLGAAQIRWLSELASYNFDIVYRTGMVSLFNSITPKEMAEFQCQDNQIAPIFTYVEQDQKPSKKVTYQIRSKLARN